MNHSKIRIEIDATDLEIFEPGKSAIECDLEFKGGAQKITDALAILMKTNNDFRKLVAAAMSKSVLLEMMEREESGLSIKIHTEKIEVNNEDLEL